VAKKQRKKNEQNMIKPRYHYLQKKTNKQVEIKRIEKKQRERKATEVFQET